MRIRFSLLTLLLLVTLTAIPLAVIVQRQHVNRRQAAIAVSLKERFRGIVRIEGTDSILACRRVNYICLSAKGFSDADMRNVCTLADLESLRIGGSEVTDEGLVHLKKLSQLEQLSLSQAPITDHGIVHIEGLPVLKKLSLRDTRITDDSISRLARIDQLESLTLGQTAITDEGLNRLRQALPSCKIIR